MRTDGRAQKFEEWEMHDKFDKGIPSWQSYPLAQDIGYDPSIYTARTNSGTVLVRDLINEGQKTQEVGLIRHLAFRLTDVSRLTFSYELKTSGDLSNLDVILAGVDGVKYEVAIPLSSDTQNSVVVSGSQFKLESGYADIEAVIVGYSVKNAPLGSHSSLYLHSFCVNGLRPAILPLLAPHLEYSSSGSYPVADELALIGKPMRVTFSAEPKRVTIKDGSDQIVQPRITIQGTQVTWTPPESTAPGLWTVEAESNQGNLTFRVLVLRDQPALPGFLLSEERLAQLRTEDCYSTTRDSIHYGALTLAHDLANNHDVGDSIQRLSDVSLLAGLQSYVTLLHQYEDAVAYNALDYRLTSDPVTLANARNALMTVCAWSTWIPPWFAAHGLRTYFRVGEFTQRISLGYDLIAQKLSPVERKLFREAVFQNSIQPTVEDYYVYDRMPTAASNHMAHSVGGAIAAWVVASADESGWRAQYGKSLAALIAAYEALLRGLFPGDGSVAEPAVYQSYAMEGMSYGIAALNSLGIVPRGTDRMMSSFWWLRYAAVPPHLILDTGDTGFSASRLPGYAWLAEHSPDPEALRFYSSFQNGNSSGAENAETPPNLLGLICSCKPSPSLTQPPASRVFPLRGSAVLREGWNSADTTISLRVGPWYNHEHHDQGSFQLAAGGELLVCEGGPAPYYTDPHYTNYFIEAPAHNTLLIDHDPFSQTPCDGRYWKALANYPRITEHLLGRGIDFVRADLRNAYGEALSIYTRNFLYLKPGLLIIRDDIQAPQAHSFSWLLHVQPGSDVLRNGATIAIDGQKKLGYATILADGPNSDWKIESAPISINEFIDLDHRPVNDHPLLSLNSTGSNAAFTVAISASAADRIAILSKLEAENANGFLQKTAGQTATALFRTNPGLLSAAGISTDGKALAVVETLLGKAKQVFVDHANWLSVGRNATISFTKPASAILDQIGASATLHLNVHAENLLEIKLLWRGSYSKLVILDGTESPELAKGKPVSLRPGKHEVSFEIPGSV